MKPTPKKSRPPVCKPPKPSVAAKLKSAASKLKKEPVKKAQKAVKAEAANVKPATARAVCPLKAAAAKAKAVASKYSLELGAIGKLAANVAKWGQTKVGITAYKSFTLTGAKTFTLPSAKSILLKSQPFAGHFGARKMFTKLLNTGMTGAAALGAIVGLGKEAYSQYEAGQLDKTRIVVATGFGIAKAVVSHAAFAGGVAVAAKIAVAVGLATAGTVGFVPIAVGIAASVVVSVGLDWLDKKYDFTTTTSNFVKNLF